MPSFVLVILAAVTASPQAVAEPPAAQPAAAAPQSSAAPLSGSVIYECDFGPSADRDSDGWPDGWTRRRGSGFHDFLKIGIAEDTDPGTRGRILRIEMNGGSASIASPCIPVTSNFSYVLEGDVKTTGLVHDDTLVTVSFLDTQGTTLENRISALPPASRQWESFRLGPFTPGEKCAAANFSLQVSPRGKRQDLHGQATFRNLRLQRLPRMGVRTPSAGNVFTAKEQVEILCEIAGIPQSQTALVFELFDQDERLLSTHREVLARGAEALAHASWKPFIPDYGFYRVTVSWQGGENSMLTRSTTLAVVRPAQLPKTGDFGWALPGGEEPLPLTSLAALLSQAGIHWAKYPVSFSDADSEAADRTAWFAERLSLQGIQMVGVLDHPPRSGTESLSIASILEDGDVWRPWVDPIMTRLSLKVRLWQLGSEQDVSLVGYPRLETRITEFKKHLERFGQEVKLGTGWRWLNEPPTGSVPLAMLNYSTDPPLTAEELETYLARSPGETAEVQRWAVLDALPRGNYNMRTRAHDLVMRMLSAKIAGAEVICVSRPFDSEIGLMNEDGTPGELFLPWRTTASAITSAQYLGQMPLAGGSSSRVFVRNGQAVMAIWNDKNVVETMYFGEEVRQVDIWGRETVPETVTEDGQIKHRLKVGPLPTFVTGLNETVARWKMAVGFEDTHLESIFGRKQTIHLKLKNFFPDGVSGELRLVAPESWKHDAEGYRFKLAPGDELRLPLTVTLLQDASSGPQPLRLDFNVAADRTYQFSVHRTLQLGLDDVTIEMTSRLRDDGMLELTQQFTNFTDKPVSFQCVLFPPGRRREARQIACPSSGPSALTFLLPKGEELIGKKIVLRAEEIGGPRVLNHAMTAER